MQKHIKPMDRFIPDDQYPNEMRINYEEVCYFPDYETKVSFCNSYINFMIMDCDAVVFETLDDLKAKK